MIKSIKDSVVFRVISECPETPGFVRKKRGLLHGSTKIRASFSVRFFKLEIFLTFIPPLSSTMGSQKTMVILSLSQAEPCWSCPWC